MSALMGDAGTSVAKRALTERFGPVNEGPSTCATCGVRPTEQVGTRVEANGEKSGEHKQQRLEQLAEWKRRNKAC